MPSDRLDMNNCRYEVFFQKVVEIDQHLRSHGLQSSNVKVFTLAPVLQFAAGYAITTPLSLGVPHGNPELFEVFRSNH